MNFIGIAKHINRHLKFVTAIFAGPDMTDVVFAHVLGSLRCNHFFTALVARGAKMPTVASRFGDHLYEDIDVDPKGQIEQIYCQLKLRITPTYSRRLFSYLQSHANYQKNALTPVNEGRRREVSEKLAPLFRRWGCPII
jgi:hypothetical protein